MGQVTTAPSGYLMGFCSLDEAKEWSHEPSRILKGTTDAIVPIYHVIDVSMLFNYGISLNAGRINQSIDTFWQQKGWANPTWPDPDDWLYRRVAPAGTVGFRWMETIEKVT